MEIERETEYRAYQLDGSIFLASHTRALLADHPGLGKTFQTLQAWRFLGCQRVLVLCPSIARFVWLRQSEQFFGSGLNFTMPLKEKDRVPSTGSAIVSYDLAIQKSISTDLLSRDWDCVVADESHYLNSLTAKRADLFWSGLVPRARYLWCLSGTPARNHMGEMWSMLFHFGVIKQNYWDYAELFLDLRHTLFGTKVLGTKKSMVPRLTQLFDTFMLRRTKGEVMSQLPAISFSVVPVEPAPVDMEMWFDAARLAQITLDQLEHQIAEEMRAADRVIQIAGNSDAGALAITGLAQKCDMSRRYTGLQKCPMVAELLKYELKEGHYDKIVIFAWHKAVIDFMAMLLKDYQPNILYGGMLISRKDRAVRKFQTDPKVRVLLANIAAAGVAIDLTAASEVAFVEASYTPGDNVQAVLRVHRDPQTRPVRCRFFSVHGSVDDEIQQINRRKAKDLINVFHEADGNSPVHNPFAN